MAVALWSWASSSCLPWMSVHGSRSHPWSHTTSMAWCFTCWETGSDYRETVKSNIVFFFSFLTSLVKKRAASSFKAAFSAVCIQIQGVYIFQFKRTLWNFSPKHQTFFQNQKQQRASVVKIVFNVICVTKIYVIVVARGHTEQKQSQKMKHFLRKALNAGQMLNENLGQ